MSGGYGAPWAAGLILLGFLACLVINYPGHISPDGAWQLAQGRAGVYNTWHPPVMAWLLGLADKVSRGAWLFMVLDSAVFFGALFAVVALEDRPRPLSLPLLVLWMVSPIVLIGQGAVLKDVLFANAALAGFAALAWAGRLWRRPARRALLLVAALVFISLASLTRQNGIVVVPFAALTLGAIVLAQPSGAARGRLAEAFAFGAGGLVLTGAVVVMVSTALSARSDGRPENAFHFQVLQVYDLAGAAARDPRVALPLLHDEAPALERFVRGEAAAHYRAAGVDNLSELPDGPRMMGPAGSAAGRQWARLIRDRPLLYLRTRAAVWLITLTTPRRDGCPMMIVGVDAEPDMLARAGLKARMSARDEWAEDYASRFIGGPLYSHLFYGLLLLVGLGVQAARWRRGDRGPEAAATLGLGLAALAFAATFFIISVDCDFRYLYFLDVAAMAVTARVVAARAPRGVSER